MTLLREIQTDIVNPAIKLSSILRKSKILSRRLKHKELEEWIERELNGYEGIKHEKLPPYRKAITQSLGQFTDGYKIVDKMPIQIPKEAEEPYRWASTIYFYESVGELETLLESRQGMFEQPWPNELVTGIPTPGGMRCIRAWKVVTSAQFQFVLENIRTRLLNFLLELEEIDPNVGEGVTTGGISSEKLQQVFITQIYGGSNIVASGNSVRQNARLSVTSSPPDEIAQTFIVLLDKVNSLSSADDKNDAQAALNALEAEARKGQSAQEKPVRKWLNFLLETAPDIGQVAIDTFTNPIKGLSTVFQKMAQRAKSERESKKSQT